MYSIDQYKNKIEQKVFGLRHIDAFAESEDKYFTCNPIPIIDMLFRLNIPIRRFDRNQPITDAKILTLIIAKEKTSHRMLLLNAIYCYGDNASFGAINCDTDKSSAMRIIDKLVVDVANMGDFREDCVALVDEALKFLKYAMLNDLIHYDSYRIYVEHIIDRFEKKSVEQDTARAPLSGSSFSYAVLDGVIDQNFIDNLFNRQYLNIETTPSNIDNGNDSLDDGLLF